jgi:hypothetical protein
MVNWDAPADVYRATVEKTLFGKKLSSPRLVLSASLAQCVRYIKELGSFQQPLYSIAVGPEAGLAGTTLRQRDIEQLGQPPLRDRPMASGEGG